MHASKVGIAAVRRSVEGRADEAVHRARQFGGRGLPPEPSCRWSGWGTGHGRSLWAGGDRARGAVRSGAGEGAWRRAERRAAGLPGRGEARCRQAAGAREGAGRGLRRASGQVGSTAPRARAADGPRLPDHGPVNLFQHDFVLPDSVFSVHRPPSVVEGDPPAFRCWVKSPRSGLESPAPAGRQRRSPGRPPRGTRPRTRRLRSPREARSG